MQTEGQYQGIQKKCGAFASLSVLSEALLGDLFHATEKNLWPFLSREGVTLYVSVYFKY